jgi:hypothetical protein
MSIDAVATEPQADSARIQAAGPFGTLPDRATPVNTAARSGRWLRQRMPTPLLRP